MFLDIIVKKVYNICGKNYASGNHIVNTNYFGKDTRL